MDVSWAFRLLQLQDYTLNFTEMILYFNLTKLRLMNFYIIRQSKSTMAPIKKYKNGTCFSRPVFCIPFTPRKGTFSPLLIVYFTSWKVVE